MTAEKMNPEIKQKWVEALRSGDYKQARSCLYDPETNSYCCLGVLTDIYRKELNRSKCFLAGGYLSDNTQEWAGLSSCDPIINPSRATMRSASDSNDILSLNFNQIADLIEENL